jgi:beta-glucosidase
LQQLLREQMGFQGMLATDWQEIENLYSTHRVAATQEDAVRLTIGSTSVDMSMVPQDVIFFDALVDLVNKGIIPESRIDESAERLLQLKKDLGLLEKDGWRVDPAIQALVASQDDINVSIDTATESLTLLKNENNTLPFTKNIQKILVVGPTGNSLAEMSGGWTIQWQG